MSDNIPFDIQMEIIKKVYDIKSLIKFRSVSKPWKSFIDSSEFIKGYGARHTQPHSSILRYNDYSSNESRCICLVEDDIETFKVQQQEFVVSPLLNQYRFTEFVGTCYGLLCVFGYNHYNYRGMLVVWNPSIRKSFGIAGIDGSHFGFGVCPVTRDPTVVKFVCAAHKPWHVEVFTLSSGVWNVIPSANLPRQSIELNIYTPVVIDKFIYWGACEKTFTDDGESITNYMVVSFDLITKEFKVVNLPDSLTNEVFFHVSVSKLRGSLVVSAHNKLEDGSGSCGVWVMERDWSFRKLFSIPADLSEILGFRKNGEPIFELEEEHGLSTLHVYEPHSQQIKQIKNLGISAVMYSSCMGSYKESLLLLDHSDLHIYSDDSLSK